MTSKTTAFFLAFCLLVLAPTAALAASSAPSARYYMATNRSFWRNAMNARHIFSDGFTADLSDLQLRIARLAGLKPILVKKFYILADVVESVSPTPQAVPTQRVSWSIQGMLGETELQSTKGGKGMHIALLDTGIERAHPDLSERVFGCFDLTEAAKGFVDGACADENGHGTHMAGVLVADGGPDLTGMYGFAPQASISAYRVCGPTGTCLSDDIAVAIQHAVDEGAQIIVLGMGGEAQSSFISDAVAYAVERGVMVVAPAGNDGPYEDSLDWPARDSSVLSVAAVDDVGEPAEFSSRGINETTKEYVTEKGDVEFAAPGVNIESTFLDGGYAILSGTSMATPHVAGLAAVLWQRNAKYPAQATRALLRELSRDVGPKGDDNATGWGIPTVVTK
jgi:subtilisin